MKKYTQKKITKIARRRGIFINNKMLKKNEIRNKLTIGIITKRNKKITQEQIITIKQDLNNSSTFTSWGGKLSKYFDIIIKIKPNKVITNKGILVRMGKGKGKIKTKAIFVLKNKVCMELIQKDINNRKIINLIKGLKLNKEINLINFLFTKFLKKYTYFKIKSNLEL